MTPKKTKPPVKVRKVGYAPLESDYQYKLHYILGLRAEALDDLARTMAVIPSYREHFSKGDTSKNKDKTAFRSASIALTLGGNDPKHGFKHYVRNALIATVDKHWPSTAMSIIPKAEALTPQPIQFLGKQLRMVVLGTDAAGDPAPGCVAKDLVEAVGAEWKTGKSGSIDHIPAKYKGAYPIGTPGGVQAVTCLTEAGMNQYLFRSDKPAAQPLQEHLAEVVLPSIRKTGSYRRGGALSAPSETVQVIQAVMQGVQKTLTQALNGMQTSLDKTLQSITTTVLRVQTDRVLAARDGTEAQFPRASDKEFDILLTPALRAIRAKKDAQKGGPLTCLPNEEQKLASEWLKAVGNMFFGTLEAPNKNVRAERFRAAAVAVYEFMEVEMGKNVMAPASAARNGKPRDYGIIDWVRENGMLTDLRVAIHYYFNKYRKPVWKTSTLDDLIKVDPHGPALFPEQRVPF